MMESRLDQREYSDAELISIKTTLHLPYYSGSPSFERAYGSININGVVYEYVKRRVYQDTLELLCLPNAAKTKLQEAENEMVKASAEEQASVPLKKSAGAIKFSFPVFFQSIQMYTFRLNGAEKNYVLQNESFHFFNFTSQPDRPPQGLSLFS